MWSIYNKFDNSYIYIYIYIYTHKWKYGTYWLFVKSNIFTSGEVGYHYEHWNFNWNYYNINDDFIIIWTYFIMLYISTVDITLIKLETWNLKYKTIVVQFYPCKNVSNFTCKKTPCSRQISESKQWFWMFLLYFLKSALMKRSSESISINISLRVHYYLLDFTCIES